MSPKKVHGIDTGCWKPVQCLKEFKTEENEILHKEVELNVENM